MNIIFRRKYYKKLMASILAGCLVSTFIFMPSNLTAEEPPIEQRFNQDMLMAVTDLYGISKDQAIDRLAKETQAAIKLKHIKELNIASYAGSWFDESSLQLKVAISDEVDLVEILNFGLDPILVDHSLADLRKTLNLATDQLLLARNLSDSFISSYIVTAT